MGGKKEKIISLQAHTVIALRLTFFSPTVVPPSVELGGIGWIDCPQWAAEQPAILSQRKIIEKILCCQKRKDFCCIQKKKKERDREREREKERKKEKRRGEKKKDERFGHPRWNSWQDQHLISIADVVHIYSLHIQITMETAQCKKKKHSFMSIVLHYLLSHICSFKKSLSSAAQEGWEGGWK